MTSSRRDRWPAGLGTCPLAVALATADWIVFRPGILSSDSIDQYSQALHGRFNNWHPPLMGLVLAGFLRLGLGLGWLVWMQAFALIGGVLTLSRRVLDVRRSGQPRRGDGRIAALAGLAVLSPLLSPSLFYAVTFWKDVWTAIAMLWLAALFLQCVRRRRDHGTSRPSTFVAFAFVVVVTPCVRHNAAVLLVPLAPMLWWSAPWWGRGAGRSWRGLVAASVVGLAGLAPAAVERAAGATEGDPAAQVLALDLVGLWHAYPQYRAQLTHTSAHVHPDLVDTRYEWGSVGPLLFTQPTIIERGLLERDPLRREWWRAWRCFPWAMAVVKWRTFWPQLGFTARRTYYWFEPGLWSEELGLRPEGWLAARKMLVDFGEYLVAHKKTTRWLGRVHGVWVLIALGLWVAARCRRRRATWRGLGAVAALAVAYHAGFLLATTMPDYRFMYPATLLVQTVVVAMGAAALVRSGPVVPRGEGSEAGAPAASA
ncbi:MAG: hypothetical protein R3F56_25425 [Planctomycetota bacterium]